MFDTPPDSCRTIAISSRDSEACVCTSVWCASDRLATASSSAREHETAKRGANAARSRPPAAPSHRLPSATLSSIDAFVCSRIRAGTSSPESIMHLPMVARMPASAAASNTTSVSCTVSIVSTVVVPQASSSAMPIRAAARSVEGVCAASIGQMRVRSQSISVRSSAEPRNSVWQRWTCVWTKPGSTQPPCASMIVSWGSAVTPRDRGDPAIADRTSPSHDVERVVHRDHDAAADQKGDMLHHEATKAAKKTTKRLDLLRVLRVFVIQSLATSLGGSHFIERPPPSLPRALPCLTAISSARMLTAISCGVTAPMSRPMGAWTCVEGLGADAGRPAAHRRSAPPWRGCR